VVDGRRILAPAGVSGVSFGVVGVA
jgi:hypothetical protein